MNNNQINALLLYRNNYNIPQLNQSNFSKFKNIIITNIILIILVSSSFIISYYKKINSSSSKNIIRMFDNDLLINYNYKNNIDKDKKFNSNTNFIPQSYSIKQYNEGDNEIKLSGTPTFYKITIEKLLYEEQRISIMSSLLTNNFDGIWESIGVDTNSSYFIGNSNEGSAIFEFDKAIERRSREEALAISIQFNEGQYIDKWIKFKSYCVYQNLNKNVNLKQKTFELSGKFSTEFEKGEIFDVKYKQKEKNPVIIKMIFPLIIKDISLKTIQGEVVNIGTIYTIDPKNFTFFLNSTSGYILKSQGRKYDAKTEENIKENKLKIYLIFVMISSLLYISSIFIVVYGIKKGEMRASALNVECLVFISLWNFYCFVSNIYLAFKAYIEFFLLFSLIGIISTIKVLFFDTWLFYTFWTIRNRNITNSCQLFRLNLRFYALYLTLLIFIFFFMGTFFFNYLGIAFNSVIIWIILIIHNIITNNRYGLPLIYIISCSIERIIYPFYFRGYENNFFMLKTNKTFLLIIVLLVIFTIMFLLAQMIIGPRFMLPKKYQHGPYNFYKNLDELLNSFKDINNEECVICLVPIVCNENSENKLYEMNEFDSDKEDENDINNKIKENDSIDNSRETKDESNSNISLNESKSEKESSDNNNDDNNLLINDENGNNQNKKEKNKDQIINDEKDEIFKVKKNTFKVPSIIKYTISKVFSIIKICFRENFLYFYKSSGNIDNKLYMLTPCNHIFHSECLEKWLELKRECPNCRASLESLI